MAVHRDGIKKVMEDASGTGKARQVARVPGTLSICEVVGINKRRYPKSCWTRNLESDSHLQGLIGRRQSWGTLEHPESGVVNLESEISHRVENLKLDEATGAITGDIVIYTDLPHGQKLMVLIEDGWDPTVSSRGYGSVIEGSDGVSTVQDDFICEGWDVVSVPSFAIAKLTPTRTNESVASPISASAHRGLPESKTTETNTKMDISALTGRLAQLQAVNILESGPTEIASAFIAADQLGRQASTALNITESAWDAGKVADGVKALTKKWSEAIVAQRTEKAVLESRLTASVKMLESSTKVNLLYRKTLSESHRKLETFGKLFETANTRGRGWQAAALKARKSLSESAAKEKTALAAVDLLAKKHVATEGAVTILAERYVQLEKGKVKGAPVVEALEKLGAKYVDLELKHATVLAESTIGAKLTPEVKTKLAECKTPAEITKLVETVTGKAPVTATPAAAPVAAPAPAPIAEAKPKLTDSVRVYVANTGPVTLNEALDVARRSSNRMVKA